MQRKSRARGLALSVLCAMAVLGSAVAGGEGSAHAAVVPHRTIGGPAGAGTARPQASVGPPDTKCDFKYYGSCESLDPDVTIEAGNIGDTSACTFSATNDWGDGTPPTTTVGPGGPDGSYQDAGDHTYGKPGKYTITASSVVVAEPPGDNCEGYANVQLSMTVLPLISGPTDGDVVAMTDPGFLSPQAGPADRAPAKRTLTVKGWDNCGACGITVNGSAAVVDSASKTWRVTLPAAISPGKLHLSLSTSAGESDTADVTFVDVRVASPGENAKAPLTADPAMPQLNATAQIDGLPSGTDPSGISFQWKLQVINKYVTKNDVWRDNIATAATGTTSGLAAPWKIPADTPLIGGWGRLTVTAAIPGLVHPLVTSDPRWIDIPGTNPGKAAIAAYIAAHAGAYADALTHIACKESNRSFNQFSPTPTPLSERYSGHIVTMDAASTKIPTGWPNPAPLRPLFGYPAGTGVMQLDPSGFPDQQWNWHSNLTGGITLFETDKLGAARAWPAQEQAIIDKVHDNDEKTVNEARAAKHLPAITVNRVLDTDPRWKETQAQLIDDAIRGYNGYGASHLNHQYSFDPGYTMSANHLELTVVNPHWALTDIPHVGRNNPDYVAAVWACN